jgi:hypothetical protein
VSWRVDCFGSRLGRYHHLADLSKSQIYRSNFHSYSSWSTSFGIIAILPCAALLCSVMCVPTAFQARIIGAVLVCTASHTGNEEILRIIATGSNQLHGALMQSLILFVLLPVGIFRQETNVMDQELSQAAGPESPLAELNNRRWHDKILEGMFEEEVHHMILTCFHTVLVCIDVHLDQQQVVFLFIRVSCQADVECRCFDVTVIDVFEKLFEHLRMILRERDLQRLAFFEVLEAFCEIVDLGDDVFVGSVLLSSWSDIDGDQVRSEGTAMIRA